MKRCNVARRQLGLALIISLLLLSAAITPAAFAIRRDNKLDQSAYKKEINRWRESRVEEIKGENGWLTLIGLFWLKPGENRFGSDPSNAIVLPLDRAPRFTGSLWLNQGVVRLESSADATIAYEGEPVRLLNLQTDADGKPTVLNLGSLSFYVIRRGGRFALRVKDKQHPDRYSFRGINYYPVDSRWRIEARFEPYDPPKIIPIVNVLGMTDEQKSPGALTFEVNGKPYRLDALEMKGSNKLFIIFADKTSGKETYGAGRYVYTDAPSGGRVILDFNKAENPPCAFTSYATCPLPPRQNRLAIAVFSWIEHR
jgi:uncharacterized protein (DUF1684 family)